MKKNLTLLLILFSMISFKSVAETITAIKSNNWSNPKSWDLERIPKCSDKVVIPKNISIILDSTSTLKGGQNCNKTEIHIFGTLNFNLNSKLLLSPNAKVLVYIGGEINPSKNAKPNSEFIKIGPDFFWKSGNGKLKGTIATDVNSAFSSYQLKETQIFTIQNAKLGGVVTGKKGTRITIAPNKLKNNSGILIDGPVTIELVEVQSKADMILMNKPTVATNSKGSRELLISGGEYFLKIMENGVALNPQPGIEIKLKTEKFDPQMQLFDGKIDGNGNLNWDLISVKPNLENDVFNSTESQTYAFEDTKWSWTNIDKFVNDPRPKTSAFVRIPKDYNPSNVKVFLVFEGLETSVAKLEKLTDEGLYTDGYGLIPKGSNIKVIVLGYNENGWLSSFKNAKINDNDIIEIESLSQTTENNLINQLINLY